jgi:hypothetical protein
VRRPGAVRRIRRPTSCPLPWVHLARITFLRVSVQGTAPGGAGPARARRAGGACWVRGERTRHQPKRRPTLSSTPPSARRPRGETAAATTATAASRRPDHRPLRSHRIAIVGPYVLLSAPKVIR